MARLKNIFGSLNCGDGAINSALFGSRYQACPVARLLEVALHVSKATEIGLGVRLTHLAVVLRKMNPDLGGTEVGIHLFMGTHVDSIGRIRQGRYGIGKHQVLVAVDLVLEQPVRSNDFLASNLSESRDGLEQVRPVVRDGFHLQLLDLAATVAQTCLAEHQFVDPRMERLEHSLQTLEQFTGECGFVFNHRSQKDGVALQFFGMEELACGVDQRLQKIGDHLLCMGLAGRSEVLSHSGNEP